MIGKCNINQQYCGYRDRSGNTESCMNALPSTNDATMYLVMQTRATMATPNHSTRLLLQLLPEPQLRQNLWNGVDGRGADVTCSSDDQDGLHFGLWWC